MPTQSSLVYTLVTLVSRRIRKLAIGVCGNHYRRATQSRQFQAQLHVRRLRHVGPAERLHQQVDDLVQRRVAALVVIPVRQSASSFTALAQGRFEDVAHCESGSALDRDPAHSDAESVLLRVVVVEVIGFRVQQAGLRESEVDDQEFDVGSGAGRVCDEHVADARLVVPESVCPGGEGHVKAGWQDAYRKDQAVCVAPGARYVQQGVQGDWGDGLDARVWKDFDTLRLVVDVPTYRLALHQDPDLLLFVFAAREQLLLDARGAGDDVLPLLRNPLDVEDLLQWQVANDALEELTRFGNAAESRFCVC